MPMVEANDWQEAEDKQETEDEEDILSSEDEYRARPIEVQDTEDEEDVPPPKHKLQAQPIRRTTLHTVEDQESKDEQESNTHDTFVDPDHESDSSLDGFIPDQDDDYTSDASDNGAFLNELDLDNLALQELLSSSDSDLEVEVELENDEVDDIPGALIDTADTVWNSRDNPELPKDQENQTATIFTAVEKC